MSPYDILHQLILLEKEIVYDQLAQQQSETYAYRPGTLPVLISAPHATAHKRNGRIKGEEEFTAAFAALLAQETGAHAFYTRYRSPDDPNWDRHSPYKTQLAQIIRRHQIRFVLDLHGMSNRHRIGIAIGTMNGRSCPHREPHIVDAFSKYQFKPTTAPVARDFAAVQWDRFVLNHPRFTGGLANHTITRYVAESLRVSAVQIELCATVRVVRRHRPARYLAPFLGDARGIRRAFSALSHVLQTCATDGVQPT